MRRYKRDGLELTIDNEKDKDVLSKWEAFHRICFPSFFQYFLSHCEIKGAGSRSLILYSSHNTMGDNIVICCYCIFFFLGGRYSSNLSPHRGI